MIDRTQPVFPLRRDVIGRAALISAALCLLLPLVALVVWLFGVGIWGMGWAVIGVVYGFLYFLIVIGFLLAVVGILSAFGGAAPGCGAAVIGLLMYFAGQAGIESWHVNHHNLAAESNTAYAGGVRWGGVVLTKAWIGWGIIWLAWVVLAVELIAALVTLCAIAVLRGANRARGRFARVHYTCPRGHRAPVAFACPGCGQWEPHLRPSIYGVARARCGGCHSPMPAADVFGRAELPKMCTACAARLPHPDLGHRGEYHLAVWAGPGADATGWMRQELEGLTSAGAVADPPDAAAVGNTALPAPMVAGPPCGRGLLYVYNLSAVAPAAAAPLAGFHGWLDAAAVVVRVGPSQPGAASVGPDTTVATLLEFWDRLKVGRITRRHRTPLAVVVEWSPETRAAAHGTGPHFASSSDEVRDAVERAGWEPLVRTLEARFGRTEYFAANHCPFDPDVPVSVPGGTVGWLGERLAGRDSEAA